MDGGFETLGLQSGMGQVGHGTRFAVCDTTCLKFIFLCLSARPDLQVMLSTWPFICLSVRQSMHSFICCQTCEHDSLKTNEPILMQICTSYALGKGMRQSTLGSRGQSSRTHEARNRFGCLVAASVLTACIWFTYFFLETNIESWDWRSAKHWSDFCFGARVDHLSGKPGNVMEFDSCQGNVRDFTENQGIFRKKSCQGKVA